MSQGVHSGVVSVVLSSWGKNLSVYVVNVVVAKNRNPGEAWKNPREAQTGFMEMPWL